MLFVAIPIKCAVVLTMRYLSSVELGARVKGLAKIK